MLAKKAFWNLYKHNGNPRTGGERRSSAWGSWSCPAWLCWNRGAERVAVRALVGPNTARAHKTQGWHQPVKAGIRVGTMEEIQLLLEKLPTTGVGRGERRGRRELSLLLSLPSALQPPGDQSHPTVWQPPPANNFPPVQGLPSHSNSVLHIKTLC